MKQVPKGLLPILCVAVISLLLFATPLPAAQEPQPSFTYRPGTGTPTSFNPPWTREKIPQEVKDKENEKPASWCKTPGRGGTPNETQVTIAYTDQKTGTRTVIHYEPGPGGATRKWVITTQELNKPEKKITYDMQTNQKTVEIKGQKPTTTAFNPAIDFAEPAKAAPGRQGSLRSPFFPNWLVNVAYGASHPTLTTVTPRENFPDGSLPLVLAATDERQQTPVQQTQKRPALNVKLVHYGKPTETPTIHLGEEPRTTPEEFVQKPPPPTWTPGDEEGPKTTPEDPTTGIPITYIPSGGINIGSGWTSARVPAGVLLNCSGDDVDTLITRARRLRELADKAEQGGPEYWDRQARTHEGNATRAENEHRPQLIEPERKKAREAKEIADELRNRGIPEKPDPNMQDRRKLAELQKERRDAIQGLRDEARELTRQAQAMLRDM